MIQTGQAWFSEELKTECEFLSYPLYFMDFEPVNPAIPRFSGMHPYDHPLSDCDCSRKWMSGQADGKPQVQGELRLSLTFTYHGCPQVFLIHSLSGNEKYLCWR
jgi:hypothetical protein